MRRCSSLVRNSTHRLFRIASACHTLRFQTTTDCTASPRTSPTPAVPSKPKGEEFSTTNLFNSDAENIDTSAVSTDMVSTPVTRVDYLQEMYGPWFVLADELQGELFMDHDKTVYLRPANGLGGGVGYIDVTDASPDGVAFSMKLDSYVYPAEPVMPPSDAIATDVTGVLKRVVSKSENYETLSLVASWRRRDGSSGKFNAVRISPWDPSTAAKPWEPRAELISTLHHVFPTELQLTSHLARLKAAKEKATGTQSATTLSQAERCLVFPPPTHMDLEPFRVGDISDIYYVPDYITEKEEEQILDIVKNTPTELKSQLEKRTAQEWGCTMCEVCEKSFVSDVNMPPWLEKCNDVLLHDGVFTPSSFPNSVRVHEYQPGEGIAPHCDGPIYFPLVSIVSLGSPCVMFFYPRREPYEQPMEHYNDTFRFDGEIPKQQPLQSIVLEPRSMMIFRRDAFHYYPHGTSDRLVDLLTPEMAGKVVNRHLLKNKDITEVPKGYRVSITTRNLLPRCNHQIERAEYAMKRAWYVYHQLPVPMPLFTTAPLPQKEQKLSSPSTATIRNGMDLQGLEMMMEAMIAQQGAIKEQLNELRQLITTDATFRREVSTVLGHLTTTMLDVDNKLEELIQKNSDASPPHQNS